MYYLMLISVPGRSLLARFQKAVLMCARHAALHTEYTAEFDEDTVTAWQLAISEWESDRTKPNPFEVKETRKYFDVFNSIYMS